MNKSIKNVDISKLQLNNKMYTLVVAVPNINGVDENGKELGGGNTAAPIYKDIVKSLMQ